MRKKIKLVSIACLSTLILLSNIINLFADDTAQNISIAKYISNLKIGGDIRLRQENFWKSTKGQVDRSRQRFRLRFGIQPQIEDFTIIFKMASGTGEQVSTNQTFDNLSGQKQIWIDQTSVEWKAFECLKIRGGRMENPFWRIYSSDLVWDGDYNPEGFAQMLKFQPHERIGLFTNLIQMVMDEDSSSTYDQWMFSAQAGTNLKLFRETKWNVGSSFYYFTNENANDFGQNAANEGNTRITGNTIRSTFTVVHLTNEFATKMGALPISFQFDYVNNLAPTGQILKSTSTQHVGYQVGAIIGKAKAAKSWEIGYFFKWAETNCTIADIADSDFGDGGTNRRGHIFWFTFNPRDYLSLTMKGFSTEVIKADYPPYADNINRLQLDMSIKF